MPMSRASALDQVVKHHDARISTCLGCVDPALSHGLLQVAALSQRSVETRSKLRGSFIQEMFP